MPCLAAYRAWYRRWKRVINIPGGIRRRWGEMVSKIATKMAKELNVGQGELEDIEIAAPSS